MPTQAQILDVLAIALAEQRFFISQLLPAEIEAEGSYADWSVKDMLAHVLHWGLYSVERLEVGANASTRLDGEIDAVNADIYAEHVDQPWEEVLAGLEEVNQRAVEITRGLSDADFEQVMSGTAQELFFADIDL